MPDDADDAAVPDDAAAVMLLFKRSSIYTPSLPPATPSADVLVPTAPPVLAAVPAAPVPAAAAYIEASSPISSCRSIRQCRARAEAQDEYSPSARDRSYVCLGTHDEEEAVEEVCLLVVLLLVMVLLVAHRDCM